MQRTEPAFDLADRPMLEAWLEYHRQTLALKCEGLSAEQLRQRAVPPSNLSLLGLVRHMADVERAWFRRRLAGEGAPSRYWTEEAPDADFDDVDEASPAEAFAAWEEECRHAREVAAAVPSLDTVARNTDQHGGLTLRWIMVHMIEEYARHNGHADFLRERIDGVTGD